MTKQRIDITQQGSKLIYFDEPDRKVLRQIYRDLGLLQYPL